MIMGHIWNRYLEDISKDEWTNVDEMEWVEATDMYGTA